MESMSQLHAKANYLAQLYRRDYLRTCKDIERLYELHEIINQALLKLKREECILMMNEYFYQQIKIGGVSTMRKRCLIRRKTWLYMHSFVA